MSNRINILHLCETFGTGGAENVMLNVAAELNSDEFKATAVLFGEGWLSENLRRKGVEVKIVETSGSYDLGLLKKLFSIIRDNQIELVQSHLPDANAYASLAGALASVPVVATYHGQVAKTENYFSSTNLKLAAVKKFSKAVVAVSHYLEDELTQLGRIDRNKIEVIYNGVDWTDFETEVDRSAKRRELGIEPEDRLVVMVANLAVEKGYEFFVRAAKKIASQINKAKFLIIGEGPRFLKEMIEQEIKENQLVDRVRPLGYREDVVEILKVSDLFMLSSISEGLSIATIEAMGVGLPVLVTASGGPEEIVTNAQTGLIVPIASAEALAEAALILLTDNRLALEYAGNARVHVLSKFGLRPMIESYANLYHRMLGGKRHS